MRTLLTTAPALFALVLLYLAASLAAQLIGGVL